MGPENPGLEIIKAAAGAAGKESVNKIAQFISTIFPFWGLKKRSIDVFVHDIEQSNLSPENKMIAIANTKKIYKEIKNQTAIIDTALAAVGGIENIRPDNLQKIDYELVSRLIDAGKFVSDEELQLLWGNVLAGEFEEPGSTPKNIVRILSELSKDMAIIFSNLCSLQVNIFLDTGNQIKNIGSDFIIGDLNASYLSELNIQYENLRDLDHLGLISLSDIGDFPRTIPHANFPYVHLVSGTHVITVKTKEDKFLCGRIIPTVAGRSISRFIPKQYNQKHMDSVQEYLKQSGMDISPTPGIYIVEADEKEAGMEYSWEKR